MPARRDAHGKFIKGPPNLKWKIDLRPMAIAKLRRACEEALGDAAEHILEEANRTIPIEEGVLTGSGSTDVDGGKASIFYDTPYAARQHEDTSLRHDPGRRAKWLELTLTERADFVRDFFVRRLGGALR